MNTGVMFSSKTDQHATPQAFFDTLNEEFYFCVDACADASNAKCRVYFDKKRDGLKQDWAAEAAATATARAGLRAIAGIGRRWLGNTVWMNPPYGREIGLWMRKAYEESLKGCIVVCLVPSRTDTAWWHDYVQGKAEVRFVRGRLKFGNAKNSAPFPSAVVIYRPPPTLD